jgi:hypothetical protein
MLPLFALAACLSDFAIGVRAVALTTRTDLARQQLERYCAVLRQALGTSPYWPIRHLVCQVDRDRIRVQGTVSSFYLKQIAQTVATKVVGVECVYSEIDVGPEPQESPGSYD